MTLFDAVRSDGDRVGGNVNPDLATLSVYEPGLEHSSANVPSAAVYTVLTIVVPFFRVTGACAPACWRRCAYTVPLIGK